MRRQIRRGHSDRNMELETLAPLSALAPMTKRIGLVCTASMTCNEPFHIACRFASLDHISGGRTGRNIGRDTHLGHDNRYGRARGQ